MKRLSCAIALLVCSSCGDHAPPRAAEGGEDRVRMLLGPYLDLLRRAGSGEEMRVAPIPVAEWPAMLPASIGERIGYFRVTRREPLAADALAEVQEILLDGASLQHGLLGSETGLDQGERRWVFWTGESATVFALVRDVQGAVFGSEGIAELGVRLESDAWARIRRVLRDP